MKHNPNNRRPRSRGGKQRHHGGRNNFESNGPEVKVRGTAQQVLDKYLALARDAHSAGDRINTENYFQHAEHYYRVLNADQANAQEQNQNNNQNNQKNDGPSRRERAANAQAEEVAIKEKSQQKTADPAVGEAVSADSAAGADTGADQQADDQPQLAIAGLPPAIPEPKTPDAESTDDESASDESAKNESAGGSEELGAAKDSGDAPKPRRRRSRKPKTDDTETAPA